MSNFFEDALADLDKRIEFEPEAPAEAETVVEPEAVEAPEAPAADVSAESEAEAEAPEARERDEKGRFTSTEKEEEAEEAAETLLAGKFRSPAELEQAYEALQSKLGTQGSELGTLRETLERLNENLERVEEPDQIAVDSDWFQENLDENPQGMAYWSRENAPHLLGKVMKQWGDEDPFAAAQFVTDVRIEAMKAEFAEREKKNTSRISEITKKTAITESWAAARADIPDLDSRAAEIVEAAKFAPEVAKGLESQNAEERVTAIKKLDYLARGMNGLQQQAPVPPVVPPASTSDPARAAAEAKLAGSVATQTQSQEAEQISEDEAWLRKTFDPVADRYHHPDD